MRVSFRTAQQRPRPTTHAREPGPPGAGRPPRDARPADTHHRPSAGTRRQDVIVTYTDPTGADDAAAIQDASGNDAADFTTGEGGVPAVTNSSTQAIVPPICPIPLSPTALVDIEPRLRKVMGYRHLPKLREALQRELKIARKTPKTQAA